METVCRLCSKQSPLLESIFSFRNGRLLSDLITIMCPIKIDINDSYPKKICKDCLQVIIAANDLRAASVKSDVSFRTGTFVALPEQQQRESPIKQEPTNESDSDDCALISITRQGNPTKGRAAESFSCPYGCQRTSTANLESPELKKLIAIEHKLDVCLGGLRASNIINPAEREITRARQELFEEKTFVNNCLETSIGPKPLNFPKKLRATNIMELSEVDKCLMSVANNQYLRKYLDINIGNSSDYKCFMKQGLEIIMSTELKTQLLFSTQIKRLQAYCIIAGRWAITFAFQLFHRFRFRLLRS